MKKITIYDGDKKNIHNIHVINEDGKYYIGWWEGKNEFLVMTEVNEKDVKNT